ncbi:2-dehydropantoate 2-reductase [Marivita sp.]|uniref:2-dehydropantoate 2-reductase n=1 Tax=Marivita sp. TaxID=2003365 RepID=UPI0026068881|nr:2-dehydropantoate 2-reductase [Marivita sp.]
MRVAVIGAGAIGGWLTSGFIEAGAEATVLARGASLAALQAHGLGLDDGTTVRRYDVHATDDPAKLRGADILLLGLKAQDLSSLSPVIERALGPQTVVVPAVNGLPWWFFEGFGGPAQGMQLNATDPGGVLARLMPADRVVGTVVHAASFVESPGNIRLVAANKVILGDAGQGGHAAQMADVLARGRVPAVASTQIHRDVWGKLWGNSNMNPLSALSRADLLQILDDDGVRGLAIAMMREMSRLGEIIGLHGFDDIDERIATTRKLGAFRTSMLQDVEAGRTLELDPILGSLVELARKLEIPTPTMDGIYGLTRLLAQSLGEQSQKG